MPELPQDKKIDALTFVRFLAALVVVFFHFGQKTQLGQVAAPMIISGPQMVSLFFVLSGFVLTVSHYSRENETPRDFYFARLARIFPAYFLALVMSYFFFYSKSLANGPLALILSFTFLQSWIPHFPLALNSPAWSLSVEVFLYLTFPYILWWIKGRRTSWKIILVIAILIYILTQLVLVASLNSRFYGGEPSIAYDLIYYFPLSHLCSFLLGIAGGIFYLTHPTWHQKSGVIPLIFFLGILGLNYFVLQFPLVLSHLVRLDLPFRSSFYSPFFLLLIMVLAFSRNGFTNLISKPFPVLLGDASYAMYILQLPVYSLYTTILAKLLHGSVLADPESQFYVYIVILVGISILTFWYIEKPCKKWLITGYNRLTQPASSEITQP